MEKYDVSFVGHYIIGVEAESKEDANNKAWALFEKNNVRFEAEVEKQED